MQQDINAQLHVLSSPHNTDDMNSQELKEYRKFARQYEEDHPEIDIDVDEDKVIAEYNKTKQGKQAMNTRLLGG